MALFRKLRNGGDAAVADDPVAGRAGFEVTLPAQG